MLKRVFKAFEYRDFRLLWFGACTSSIGTWMQTVAQNWLVLEMTNSPFLLGLDSFLGQIPIFLFSLIGGVVADRADRRKLLVGSQLGANVVRVSTGDLVRAVVPAGLAHPEHFVRCRSCSGVRRAGVSGIDPDA